MYYCKKCSEIIKFETGTLQCMARSEEWVRLSFSPKQKINSNVIEYKEWLCFKMNKNKKINKQQQQQKNKPQSYLESPLLSPLRTFRSQFGDHFDCTCLILLPHYD